MFIASLLRFLLVVLAGVYVWRAIKRALWGGRPSNPPTTGPRRPLDRFADAEDIEYEDIE